MPKMNLSHFEAALLFALFTSIVLGVVTKRTDHDRLRYGLRSFAYFMAALFGLAWLMHFGHG
jgi:ABC-type dipeptide/oligopeptide/nickel transport system permease component